MKATDLRVNNLVKHKDRLIEICGTTDAGVYVYSDSMHGSTSFYLIEEIKPIELTEEWLLKMGFVKDVGYRHTKLKLLGRWIINKSFMSDEIISKPFLRFDGLTDVYYVHQLQNFFNALTGEELTIK